MMLQEKNSSLGQPVSTAAVLARLVVILVLFSGFLAGGFVAGVAFHDPDTCWLLALGRWIVEHNQLPVSDPFSWSFAGSGRPFVLYQWLFELIIYCIFRVAGLTGILLMAALVITTAFMVLPFQLLRKMGVPVGVVLPVVTTGVFAGSFHFLARPEIFSYLLESIALYLLLSLDQKRSSDTEGRIWMLVVMPALMVLWCNLHSGFVIGLLLLVVYAFVIALHCAARQDEAWKLKLALESLLLCAIATLLNPWGTQLWSYLPSLFFSQANANISELRPIEWSLSSIKEFSLPFLALLLCGLLVMAGRWMRRSSGKMPVFPLVLFLLAGTAGLCCRRLIPFCALMMVPAPGLLFAQAYVQRAAGGLRGAVGSRLNQMMGRSGSWLPPLYVMIVIGCLFITQLIPPQLPQECKAFKPPWKAIDYLKANPVSGRLFNDPEYGDVMIWNLPAAPLVFCDSRFDMYGERLVGDYHQMTLCRGDWQKKLDAYGIRWIFLRAGDALARRLSRTPGWKVMYQDDDAIIAARHL